MRLVEQVVLVFRGGRTEKVYEVDLCEVSAGKWVVNYRYGRRGANLKDGTKTLAPVSESQARKEFDKLVTSKRNAGYTEGEAHAVTPEPPPRPAAAPANTASSSSASRPAPESSRSSSTTGRRSSEPPEDTDPRRQAVLNRLHRGDGEQGRRSFPDSMRHLAFRRRGQSSSEWSLSRAIWRAGEMQIEAAVPLLCGLVGTDNALRDYSIAWAIGRCQKDKVKEGAVVDALESIRGHTGRPAWVRRIATAALLAVLEERQRKDLAYQLVTGLPDALQSCLDDEQKVIETLDTILSTDSEEPNYEERDPQAWAALELLYLLDVPQARAAVLRVLSKAKLQPPSFVRFRAIFKLAEFRRDGQVFGAIAHRFAMTPAMYRVSRWGYARVPDRSGRGRSFMNSDQLRAMLASRRPTAAYGSKTRAYLQKRVWRTLKRLGKLEDPDYIKLAVGVLLPFDDRDLSFMSGTKRWDNRIHRISGRVAFNHILFENSDRFRVYRSGWRNRRYGQAPEATKREEAFQKLWDEHPAALLHLIDESACVVVHEFAVRALAAQRTFVDELPVEAVAMILSRPYEATVRFGFELAQRRYAPGVGQDELRALALAVCTAALEDVRAEGYQWVERSPAMFVEDGGFLGGLLASRYSDSRAFAKGLLEKNPASTSVAQEIVAAIVARIVALTGADADFADELANALEELFPSQLAALSEDVLVDLLDSEIEAVQAFGARVLLARAETQPPSDATLEKMLDSKHLSVQALGVQIFGTFDDAKLLDSEDLLWSLTTHKNKEMRNAIRPAVKRLAGANPDFAQRFLQMLIASVLRRRLPQGAPAHVVDVLRVDFASHLADVPSDVVWRLLRSESTAAQELGGVLLPNHLDPSKIDLAEVIELANHQVLSVRQAACGAAEKMVERFRVAMGSGVRLLDAKWEDSRVFAFKFFEANFTKADFTPAVLVSICDSIRPDVQRFGRKLISLHFDEAHGDEYLMKLAEHPSSDVQLFATNYLERYAANDADKLEELGPYFVRILCQVNRGRAAKKRAHAFLRTQAAVDEACATVVAKILNRQSATMAIEDKALSIETLTQIARQFPSVDVVLKRVPPEQRGERAAS